MLASPRVLIAETEAALREVLLHHLLDRGVLSDVAANGDEAVADLDDHQYRLVLLDLALPIVGALQVFQRLAAIPSGERPIVMVMASDEDARVLDIELVQVILRKPFDTITIADVVANCLRPAPAGAASPRDIVPSSPSRELRDH